MSVDKAKLLQRINEDMQNGGQTLSVLVNSENYGIAAEMKRLIVYLANLEYDIKSGLYDLARSATDTTESA